MFALRIHNLLSFPVFIDEGFHLLRAQRVFEFSDPLSSFVLRKLLTYYYLGLFAPQNHNALWIGRAVITLLAPLAAALCYAILRSLKGSFRGGMLTIWLYALVPLLFLFDRMAMSDTLVMTLGLAVVWSSLLLARRPDVNQGAATGFLLGLTLLAKLTALPLVIVPIVTLGLFGRIQIKLLAVCYVVTGMLLFLPVCYLLLQRAGLVEQVPIVDSLLYDVHQESRLDQIHFNIEMYSNSLEHTVGPLVLGVAVLAAIYGLYAKPKATIYLLASLLIVWIPLIMVAGYPILRYLMLGFPLLLVVIGLSASSLLYQPWGARAGIVLMASVIYSSSPYVWRGWFSPERLNLGNHETSPHLLGPASGFALREIMTQVEGLPTESGKIPLTALIVNCPGLRLLLTEDSPVMLHCLYFEVPPRLGGHKIDTEWIQATEEAGVWYFLVDKGAESAFRRFAENPIQLTWYGRPDKSGSLTLYQVRVE